MFLDLMASKLYGVAKVRKLPLPALRCTVDVRDGSAQFVL